MAITIFLCYDHQDERMVKKLKNHLSILEHRGHIAIWDHGDIRPGAEREHEISKHFEAAQIILLLISSSFLASKYYYRVEMQHAIERHERKGAQVIPVILRPAYWDIPPIDKLKALPDHDKPITRWNPRDEGFKNVVDGIARVIAQWNAQSLPDLNPAREALVAKLEQLIETVKTQIQPPPRANAMASTLQQLSIFIPNDVAFADLVVGWRTLSQPSHIEEPANIAQRRVTCGELARLATQFTDEQGDVAGAVKTWRIWLDAFANSGDPRQGAMASTFARELSELEEAAR